MTNSEQLAQRKQEAAEEEAAWVAHFGPEASNYANWAGLWLRGFREELVNPSPTAEYQPKGLPLDWVGGRIAEDGCSASAFPPNLYGDKFLFYFARQLTEGRAELVAEVADMLAAADEIDCDQFTAVVDDLTVYLHSPLLHHIAGSGYRLEVGEIKPEYREAFFLKWNNKKDNAGLLITWLGVAIPNKRVVPADVAKGKLQAVRRQIEARQQQLQAGVFTPTPKERKTPLPTLALMLIYERRTLQRGEQANALARDAGHSSGDSLYNEHCRYSVTENRIGFDNDTALKGRNMIKRIQAALPHLSAEAKKWAENEVAIIEARIS